MIRTTAEHPFYVPGHGWTAVRDLLPGDELLGRDGRVSRVEETLATGVWEKVYNFRVAEYHTYFVGNDGWGFDVWAHNACFEHVIGAQGERAARAHVRNEMGFDRIYSIRNNSNHGIDIVASKMVPAPGGGTVRQYSFFEVKTSAGGVAPNLSEAQRD